MSIEAFGGKSEKEQFADLAVNRARSLLAEIDPMLSVYSEYRTIRKHGSDDREEALVLVFRHKTNPEILWTMGIADNRSYFDEKFEQALRKIYKDITHS